MFSPAEAFILRAGGQESVMIRLAVPVLLLAAADAAQTAPDPATARIEKAVSGLAAGETRNCVQRQRVSEITSARGQILFSGGKTRKYLNAIHGDCPGLARGDLIVVQTIGGDYCAGDTVRTRAPSGTMSGSCILGKFTTYTKPGVR
jgi:hypothetical protein